MSSRKDLLSLYVTGESRVRDFLLGVEGVNLCVVVVSIYQKNEKTFPQKNLNPLILNVMLYVVCMGYSTIKYILVGLFLLKQIVCIEVYQVTKEQKVNKGLEDDIVEYSTC